MGPDLKIKKPINLLPAIMMSSVLAKLVLNETHKKTELVAKILHSSHFETLISPICLTPALWKDLKEINFLRKISQNLKRRIADHVTHSIETFM